jgi:hypothetical protein
VCVGPGVFDYQDIGVCGTLWLWLQMTRGRYTWDPVTDRGVSGQKTVGGVVGPDDQGRYTWDQMIGRGVHGPDDQGRYCGSEETREVYMGSDHR